MFAQVSAWQNFFRKNKRITTQTEVFVEVKFLIIMLRDRSDKVFWKSFFGHYWKFIPIF
jgi:hypothetical protein